MKTYWKPIFGRRVDHCWRERKNSISTALDSSCGLTYFEKDLGIIELPTLRCKNCLRALEE